MERRTDRLQSAKLVALAAAAFVAWQLREALLLLFAGFLFALFLGALADWVHERTGMRRGVALAGIVALLVALVALLVWLGGSQIAAQVSELRTRLPEALERLRERVEGTDVGRAALDRAPDPEEAVPSGSTLLRRAQGVVSSTLGALGSLFVIVLFGIFLASEPTTYREGVLRLVRSGRRNRVREALVEAGDAVRRWLLSKALRMLFIGLATYVALRLLGVPVAFLLAAIAALLTFVPNFGPIVAAVPAVLLALMQGPTTALWVVALYVTIQFVEGNVLDPILTKKVMAVPPALTFGAQILLGVLAGAVGLAVATPLTAGALVIVRRLYVEDRASNGDDGEGRA